MLLHEFAAQHGQNRVLPRPGRPKQSRLSPRRTNSPVSSVDNWRRTLSGKRRGRCSPAFCSPAGAIP